MIAFLCLFCCLSFVSLTWSGEPIKPIPKKPHQVIKRSLTPADSTYITSCMRQLTIETRISNDWLRRNIGKDAVAQNINNVDVEIYHSAIARDGGYVHCYYKSANGDIPNLVYKYPCQNARKDTSTDYQHRYICTE